MNRREMLQWLAAGVALPSAGWRPWSRAARLPTATAGTAAPPFADVAAASGIRFRHDNAASAQKYLIETMGAGCAWLDYDQDGYMDLYLANGAATPAYHPPHPLRGALYHNNGDGTFTDVTRQAGVGAEGLFAMGVAVGDYDNDGYPDLLVLGYGRSILFHNRRDGTFEDVTQRAGVANAGHWASSAAWFDYDRDGRLDLVIANYVQWSPATNFYCGARGPGLRSYCLPDDFPPAPPALFHNNGDGTFTDVSAASGIARHPGNGLGVVACDYDDDGWTDIFIANDSMANSLFHNQHDGTFREVAYEAGVAVGANGEPEAGMGVDAGDAFGSGRMDLIVTHLDSQLPRLYQNLGGGQFQDATISSGIGYTAYHRSEFGTRFMDFDNAGALDVFMACGHVLDNVQSYNPLVHYAEPKMMFRNLGGGHFRNVSAAMGPDFLRPRVSRGAAVGDYDNDGRLDILVNNNGEHAQLLRNQTAGGGHWLQVFLIGTRSNRDAVGARVQVTAGGWTAVAQRQGGMSYQSAQDPRLHFGLGPRPRADRIEVLWPSGAVTRLGPLAADQTISIEE
ncbi:MAG: CRTAC1 family protein, partial [Terriglobales bacterium]